MVRFQTPFLSEQNAGIIALALQGVDVDAVKKLFSACPPEFALIALAAAALKQR